MQSIFINLTKTIGIILFIFIDKQHNFTLHGIFLIYNTILI